MSNFNFLLRTAYRDSRKNRGKLFLFMSSIILGISALVAINGFNYNLIRDVDNQSKSLLGADVQVASRNPLNEKLAKLYDEVPGERATERELFSMSYLPSVDETQYVRIKAIKGNFPFYGEIKTVPAEAFQNYQSGKYALVDDGMMLEYGLQVGDSIKLGKVMFEISGRLMNSLGALSQGANFAPTIYIGNDNLNKTGLITLGSFVDYGYYRKLPAGYSILDWQEKNEKVFRQEKARVTTLDEQKENLGNAFSYLNTFLNLVALVALILGCIGVASSVYIYVKNKIPSIAVFRCLGMKGQEALMIFFLQISVLGTLAVLIGAALGTAIQMALPFILKDVLPYQIDLVISWKAIFQGIGIGTLITILFALVPLLSVRLVSPLRVLRASFDEDVKPRDPLKWLIYVAIFLAFFGFLWSLNESLRLAFAFTIGLLIAFGVLYLVASLVMWAVKKFFPRGWSFVFRQGLANLYRPDNQTRTLIVSIGLGTSILTTLFIVQGLLLNNVSQMDAGKQPNLILFGIESNQKNGLADITTKNEMPLIEQVPIVTMKLAEWKGRTKAEWMADTTATAERWAMNREARVTYRDTIQPSETLLEGEFTGNVEPGDSIFISLDQRYAGGLDVEIGDELIWNVQGAMVKTYVGSIRRIEFLQSMRPIFFILFPNGVLEEAPQFHVLVTKSPNKEALASYRREVVKTFPNISVVDLASILVTFQDILNKITYVIRFMALFSILTGLIVLISSLLLSKFQRIKESVLLRTIGASESQLLKINATEYAMLGALSAATGILLALGASYMIATQELKLDFDIQWWPIILIFLSIMGITILIGLLNSREVLRESPLAVLRKELG